MINIKQCLFLLSSPLLLASCVEDQYYSSSNSYSEHSYSQPYQSSLPAGSGYYSNQSPRPSLPNSNSGNPNATTHEGGYTSSN